MREGMLLVDSTCKYRPSETVYKWTNGLFNKIRGKSKIKQTNLFSYIIECTIDIQTILKYISFTLCSLPYIIIVKILIFLALGARISGSFEIDSPDVYM